MSSEEEPVREQDGGDANPLAMVLARLERINVTLFQMDNRLQQVEKPPPS